MDCLLQHCFVFLGGYFTGHLPKPTVQNRKNKKNNGRSTPCFLAPLNQVGLPGRVCCINSQWKTLDILDTSHWSNQASITEAHNRSTLESESPPKGLVVGYGHPGCWLHVLQSYVACIQCVLVYSFHLELETWHQIVHAFKKPQNLAKSNSGYFFAQCQKK